MTLIDAGTGMSLDICMYLVAYRLPSLLESGICIHIPVRTGDFLFTVSVMFKAFERAVAFDIQHSLISLFSLYSDFLFL